LDFESAFFGGVSSVVLGMVSSIPEQSGRTLIVRGLIWTFSSGYLRRMGKCAATGTGNFVLCFSCDTDCCGCAELFESLEVVRHMLGMVAA